MGGCITCKGFLGKNECQKSLFLGYFSHMPAASPAGVFCPGKKGVFFALFLGFFWGFFQNYLVGCRTGGFKKFYIFMHKKGGGLGFRTVIDPPFFDPPLPPPPPPKKCQKWSKTGKTPKNWKIPPSRLVVFEFIAFLVKIPGSDLTPPLPPPKPAKMTFFRGLGGVGGVGGNRGGKKQ